MNSRTTENFRRLFAELPSDIQRQARDQYRLFQANPQHNSLQFKKVHSKLPVYSVRININYRAVGIQEQDTLVWFWIGGHADYEALLKRL
jgi:hypothetical protein